MAIRRYSTRLPRLRREFAKLVRQYTAEATGRGILCDGAFIHGIQQLCVEEMTRRVEAARDAVKDLVGRGSWPASPEEAVSGFDNVLAAEWDGDFVGGDIGDALRNAIAITGPLVATPRVSSLML
jgi:hypothetical protein